MRNRRASAYLSWIAPGWMKLPGSKKKGKRRSRRSSSHRRSSGESEPVAEPDPEAGDFLGDRVRGRGDDSEVVLVLLVPEIPSNAQRRSDRVGIGSPEAETEGGVGGIVERVVVRPLALHPSKGDASAELPAQRGNPCARSDENPLAIECVLGEREGWTGCVQYGVARCVAAKTRDAHTLGKSMAVAARQGVGIVRKILLLTGYRIPQVMMGAEALLNREVDIDSLGRYPGHADIGRRVAGLRSLIAIADGGVLVEGNLIAGRREPAVNAERALGLSSRGTKGQEEDQGPRFDAVSFDGSQPRWGPIVSVFRGNWNARRRRLVSDKLEHHAAQLCAIGMPIDAKPLRTGETQHGRVRGEHVADDSPHAVPAGGIDEHGQELPADPAALPGIGDGDREFAGDVVREARVARHADRGFRALDRRRCDQRHIAPEIDAGEFLQHLRCESDTAAEEAVIARFFRELARELGLEVDVLGADWTNRDRVCDAQGPGRNQVRGIGRGTLRRRSVPGAHVGFQALGAAARCASISRSRASPARSSARASPSSLKSW